MGEEPDPQDPDHRPQPSAGGYWSTPGDDAGEADASELEPQGAGVTTDARGASDSVDEAAPAAMPPRSPTAALGWVALSFAAACVIADVLAVILATQRYWVSATLIAQGANAATAIVFVVGLFAAFRRPARWLGIGAMVVAILANPFILTHLLTALGG